MNAIVSEVSTALVPRCELTAEQIDEMFHLLVHHFEGVSLRQFTTDLAEKNWVILVTRENRLVGFSTLLAYEAAFDGNIISVVYSGDTIMAREGWGTTALARAWIASVNHLRESYPRGDYYWLLLTSGFRTYRFLPVFWREFYPRFDAVTPLRTTRLLNHLARMRFGKSYRQGIVHFPNPQRLRDGLAEVPRGRMADPHVAFFLAQNPGHRNGDELVCLTQLHANNLTAAGRRMVDSRPYEADSSPC